MTKQPPRPVYSDDYVRDVSAAVYRARLGPDDAQKIDDDPKRGPDWIRRNSASYDGLTRAYLDAVNALGIQSRAVKP
jgi:hypothetical protein